MLLSIVNVTVKLMRGLLTRKQALADRTARERRNFPVPGAIELVKEFLK